MVVADSSAVWAAALLFWVGLVIFPAAVNFAKGKFWWGLFAFLGFLWIFGVCAAIRLAKTGLLVGAEAPTRRPWLARGSASVSTD